MRPPSEYAVILEQKVYERLLECARLSYPVECYGFLAGRVLSPTVYRVTHLHVPESQVATPSYVEWTEEARLEATAEAAVDGSHFLGWAHSHPYPGPQCFGACQSRQDARVQAESHFTLSLIVALYGRGSAAIGAWLLGYPAPLDVCTSRRSKLVRVRSPIKLP